jgi:hypothetical protein
MADDGFDGERLQSSRSIFAVIRRFCPEVNTLNLYSGGALWPR